MFKKKKAEPKELTPEAALEKARRFCHYQERASSEVIQRLKEWNVTGEAADTILTTLREENWLDDARFAKAFVRGKFKIKNWGTNKILAGLRTKSIPEDLIKEALAELPQEEMQDTLVRLLEKKNAQLKEPNVQKRKSKLGAFAMQKGYRGDAVWKTIDALVKKTS